MIIVGDIASPSELHSKILYKTFENNENVFKKQTVICNFEGLISKNQSLKDRTPVLFNHPSVLKALNKGNVKVAGLANNHILDLPLYYDETTALLIDANIQTVGAGKTKNNALEPVIFEDDGVEIFLINACWDFLLYHQKNPTNNIYINTINEFEILNQVKEIRKNSPNAKIVTFFHWSFDLERLPFPMYRQFSYDLIEAGVSLVVGAHSHCVQGGELYKNGCIIYGLGNFFIPNGVFANSKLKFPNWASEQLAIEWDIKSNIFKCHWFISEGSNEKFKIEYLESTQLNNDTKMSQYAPYQHFTHEKYINFFKKNRRKRLLIPVFKNYKKRYINSCKLVLLKMRAKLARLIANMGLIKWQN